MPYVFFVLCVNFWLSFYCVMTTLTKQELACFQSQNCRLSTCAQNYLVAHFLWDLKINNTAEHVHFVCFSQISHQMEVSSPKCTTGAYSWAPTLYDILHCSTRSRPPCRNPTAEKLVSCNIKHQYLVIQLVLAVPCNLVLYYYYYYY